MLVVSYCICVVFLNYGPILRYILTVCVCYTTKKQEPLARFVLSRTECKLVCIISLDILGGVKYIVRLKHPIRAT